MHINLQSLISNLPALFAHHLAATTTVRINRAWVTLVVDIARTASARIQFLTCVYRDVA